MPTPGGEGYFQRGEEENRLSDRWRDRVRILTGLLVGGILLWLGLRTLSWQDLGRVFAHVRWPWLVVSWVTIPVGTGVKTLRWRYLLQDGEKKPSWLRLLGIFAVGQLVDAFVLSNLGDLTRAYLVSRASDSTLPLTLGTIVVEKALDGMALLCLIVVLALSIALPKWFGTAALSFAALFVLLAIVLVLVTLGRESLLRWCSRLPGRLRPLVRTGLEGLTAFRRPATLLPTGMLTLLVWLLGLATNYSLFMSLGLPPTVLGAMLLLVVLYLAVLIPGVPALVGLFHYVTILALGALGVGRELSMPYAIVLHALIYGTMVVLGVGSLWWLSIDWQTLRGQLRTLPGRATKGQ